MNLRSQVDSFDRYRQPDISIVQLQKQSQNNQIISREIAPRYIEQVHFERYEPVNVRQIEKSRVQAAPTFYQSSLQPQQQHQRMQQQKKKTDSLQMAIEESLPTSSKKMKLTKLEGKLNKSLEEFFLKDGESSYVDEISMMKHYNM